VIVTTGACPCGCDAAVRCGQVGVQEHATVDRDPEVTYIVNCVCEFGRQLIDVLRSLPVWLVAVVGIEICDHCDHFWLIHLICVLEGTS
jgi:hypothetical protein